jgi:hypothetical protein
LRSANLIDQSVSHSRTTEEQDGHFRALQSQRFAVKG